MLLKLKKFLDENNIVNRIEKVLLEETAYDYLFFEFQ